MVQSRSNSEQDLQSPETVSVSVESGSYDVYIGENLLEEIGIHVESENVDLSGVAVVTDENIMHHYGKTLRSSLEDLNFPISYHVIPPGEREKSLTRLQTLADELLDEKMDRSSLLLAVGGGVIGDLGGFLASVYMRGIPLMQVPTTLLAQVDAATGGKVAVNLPRGKNLLGNFYHPLRVISDVSVLQTLPEREFREGLAEVVKYGIIVDAEFLTWIEEHTGDILNRRSDVLQTVVGRSVAAKAEIVEKDEKGNGLRQILNFGHTIGHGLEAASGYESFLHGEAVSVGMIGALRVSEKTGVLQEDFLEHRVETLLRTFDLPITAEGVDSSSVLRHMKLDKKGERGTPSWVLAKKAGHVSFGQTVSEKIIRETVEELTGE